MTTSTAATTSVPRRKRPSPAARRLGYTIGLLVNAAMLFLINVSPGWKVLPFLTDDFRLVLGLVNASIVVGLVSNAFYIVSDPPWVKALGDLAQTIVGVVAMVRLWQVFPLDFGDSTFPWDVLARWLLAVGIGGSMIGLVVGLVSLGRAVREPPPGAPPR